MNRHAEQGPHGLSADLAENEGLFRSIFHNCSDIVFRTVDNGKHPPLLLLYTDGLCDSKTLDLAVLKPLLNLDSCYDGERVSKTLIAIANAQKTADVQQISDQILSGYVAVLVQGQEQAIMAELRGYEMRSVEEPSSEGTVRGPRDGFTENLRVNTSLIRRRIRTPKLKMEPHVVGSVSRTDIVIAYVEDIVTENVLEEVRQRLASIRIDSVMDSGYIEEFLEDETFTPFPQIQNTERPDVVCASLMEGKVAILADNTPFMLIVPMTFWSGLQAAEDFYERSLYTTLIRWVRYILLNISLFLPSIYVAITTFHPQLVPSNLLIGIASAREGVPFPAIVEAFMMEFMFEGLREAGIRLPKPVGSAVSIVGALVIGQAAVEAGIISAPMVIVVSTTGIASFGIPRYNFGTAYRILRFPMLIMAGAFGLFGVIIGAVLLLSHLVSLRSFGVPYLSPIAPVGISGLKDVWVRAPRWSMWKRPPLLAGRKKRRIPKGQKPEP